MRCRARCFISLALASVFLLVLPTMRNRASAGESRTLLSSGCTIVAACQISQQRLDLFVHALRTWVSTYGVDEVVIVDWSSMADLRSAAEDASVGSSTTITILQIETSLKWQLTIAYNQGFKLVKTEYVLKVDCDTAVGREAYTENSLGSLALRYASWEEAENDNDVHLNGVFLTKAAHLRAVGGFDERFALYGWDDSDLYERIDSYLKHSQPNTNVTNIGHMKRKSGNTRLFHHLHHNRTMASSMERLGICFNRDVSQRLQLKSWAQEAGSQCKERGPEIVTGFRLSILKCRVHSLPIAFHIKVKQDESLCLDLLGACVRKTMVDSSPTFLCDKK